MKGFEIRCFFSNKENDWDKNKLDQVRRVRRDEETRRTKDNDEEDDLAEAYVLCSLDKGQVYADSSSIYGGYFFCTTFELCTYVRTVFLSLFKRLHPIN